MECALYLTIGLFLIVLAMVIKPVRKAIGLLFVILGVLGCLTLIGLLPGIVAIVIGGIMLVA